MSSVYDGISGDLSLPAAVNISSSTNASPIAVTTASPHGLLTGARASIYSHQTNTNANGSGLTVTKTGANTFTINGSTGNGVGGATGTVQPLTYGSATTIPSDGDARNAASVNVPFETLLDRSALVLPDLGYVKMSGRQHLTAALGFGWASFSGTLSAATATAMTLNALTSQTVPLGGSMSVKSAAGPYSFSGLVGTDFIRAGVRSVGSQGTSLANTLFMLYYAVAAPSAAAPAFGSYAQVPSCSCPILGSVTSNQLVDMSGWITNAFGINGFDLYFQPVLYSPAGGAFSGGLTGDAQLFVEVYRSTGVPQ